MTKDTLRQALENAPHPAGGTLGSHRAVLWATVCDTYASAKLQLPAGAGAEQCRSAASSARAAADAQARASTGAGLASFIVEFVDDNGKVLHTERYGAMHAAPGAASPQPNQPTGMPAGKPATTAPASSAPAPGHTPIQGLAGGPPNAQKAPASLAHVRHVVAVGAGKGGVGKSTVSVNVAVGLARRGYSVGLLDADIYGPSMPTMMGLSGLDAIVHQGMLQPFLVHGVKVMTIGKLVDPDKPLIWRGPMAHGAFTQLSQQTEWGDLDYLIIDLPPGTGDVSLSMAQQLQLTGAVVVCTPQKVAQDDAVRAVKMFQQLSVPVLGVVENMSCFVGDDGKTYDIFGRGGAQSMAQRLNLPFLGEIPITMALRQNSDSGNPSANFTGKDAAGLRLTAALEELLTTLEGQVALAGLKHQKAKPKLTIS